MKTKFLPICILIILIFTACKSKEEKANELIKADLYKTLYDFSSYEPIETIVDSAFTSVYRDSAILKDAYTVQMCLDNVNDYLDKVKDARSSMDIWSDSYSSYGRSQYNDAKEEFATNLDKAEVLMNKVHELMPKLKEAINNFEPSFCGFQAKHKFRCKTKGGNFTIGNYVYIMDDKIETILSSYDLDDEDDMKIRKFIDDLKEN